MTRLYLCGLNIRRLTAAERAARDEAAGMHYDTLFAEIEAAERAEYESEFSPEFLLRHPFKPKGARVHAKVLARLAIEQQESF